MARGNSKLGRRGRGDEAVEEPGSDMLWSEQPSTPAAPSPARNILPGEPFEPVAPFPTQRSPEPAPFAATPPAGWGFAPGAPGAGTGFAHPGFENHADFDNQADFGNHAAFDNHAGFGNHAEFGTTASATEPGLIRGDASTLSWPSDSMPHPMPATPTDPATHLGMPGQPAPDPLDALQHYAGLPLGNAAPAPDPSQVYSAPASPQAPYGQPHVPGQPSAPQTQAQDQQTQQFPIQSVPQQAPSGTFADGGIFPGNPFDAGTTPSQLSQSPFVGAGHGVPSMFEQPAAPVGHLHRVGDAQHGPTFDSGYGHVPEAGDEGWRRRGRRRSKPDVGRRRAEEATGPTAGWGSSRRVAALVGAVAVLGAAGYVGYTQLSGSGSDSTSTAAPAPARPAAPVRYALPAQLADLTQFSPAQVQALTNSYTKLAAQNSPELPPPLLASAYHQQNRTDAVLNVVVYKPGPTATYDALLASLSRPAPGNASVTAVPVAPGAAGGTMMCGSQRGASATAWCAWNSTRGIGFVQAKNTANPSFAAIYTRELRAYAEH